MKTKIHAEKRKSMQRREDVMISSVVQNKSRRRWIQWVTCHMADSPHASIGVNKSSRVE